MTNQKKISATDIYDRVFRYCKDAGFVDRVLATKEVGTGGLVKEESIGESGLDVLDAVHCIVDKSRTMFFLEEIAGAVQPGMVVFEAGIGTGILSFMAAVFGARVYGVELNPAVFTLASDIEKILVAERLIPSGMVTFVLGNALSYVPPEKADIVISENIYTGLFHEKQVGIMHHAQTFLNSGAVAIPSAIRSYAYLAEISEKYLREHQEETVPSHHDRRENPPKQLTNDVCYSDIVFLMQNGKEFEKKIDWEVLADGEANAMVVYSEVILPSGRMIGRDDTTFLNSDIYISLRPDIGMKKGDRFEVTLGYRFGTRTDDIKFSLRKV